MRHDDRQIDPEAYYLAVREELEDQCFGLRGLDEELSWTAQARSHLLRSGAVLPTCRLDPQGPTCFQDNHGHCSAACRVGMGRHRCDILEAAQSNLEALGGPYYLSTLVDPSWLRADGALGTFDLAKAKNMITQRFYRLGATNYGGFGMFEVDHNISRKGRSDWSPHLHLTTAGLSKRQLQEALRPRGVYPPDHRFKPLVIKKFAIEELPKILSYSTKHFSAQRVEGLKVTLPSRLQLECERFLVRWRSSDMLFLVRLRRYGTKLVSPNL